MRFAIASVTFLFLFFLHIPTAWAASEKYITIVNPIRGRDFFQLQNAKPSDNLQKQWDAVRLRNLSATWLVRPDALQDQEVVRILKTLPGSQEIGLFMEITPTWTNQAAVGYRQSRDWHDASSVFLTGYELDERKKLIDSAFNKFNQEFGYYPKSVGAWWIDGGSLTYMKEQYGVVANMDVADQYTTDNYQVWGQYWSIPFYPSKKNALVPASGEDQKIGVVTIQWATRDPFNAYGNGTLDSTYSVQANDYANPKFHNLDINYFNKLLDIYLENPTARFGQVTVGLENDFSWDEFGREYSAQLDSVASRRQRGTMVVRMSDFASRYNRLYPGISGPYTLTATDPLGSDGQVIWFQNTKYRIGWFYNQSGSVIRDLRLYDTFGEEPCLNKSCDHLNLAEVEIRNIDEVTYGDKWIIDEGRISDVSILDRGNSVDLTYKNQLGNTRSIKFLENDISIDGLAKTVARLISEIAYGDLNRKEKIDFQFTHQLKEGLVSVVISQIKGLIVFSGFAFFVFLLPGLALLRRIDLTNNSKFILAWPVGIAVFTLWSYLLGHLNLWWGTVCLPLLSLILLRNNLKLPRFGISRINLTALTVIILGSITWLLTSIKNGLIFDYGMGFWGPHGHDAIWHLSLIESIKSGLPLQNPIFAGGPLQNYHYFYDLLLASTSVLTTISSVDLYFRFFPLIISLGIGGVTYLLASRWFKSSLAGIFACFFVYFGGSFGWIVSYFRDKSLGGETLFWAQQAISTLINPPFAISILLLLAGLFLFHKVIRQKNKHISQLVPLVLLWGTVIEFKAYAGILILGSLAIVTLVELFKKNFQILKLSIPVLVLSLLVFLPNNLGSESLLVFAPFWLIHSMIDFPDRLNLLRLTFTRLSGYETGNIFKIVGAEGLGLLIFLIGNLGSRLVGVFTFRKLLIKDSFSIFILTFLSLALILPMLFIQKGANFNTIQFFYYFIVIFGFLSAVALKNLIERFKIFGWIIVVLIVLLTIPTTLDTLKHYLPERPPARVSNLELEALEFLKDQPNGFVVSPAFDKFLKDRYTEPIPLMGYIPSGYISAFSGKNEFIADTVNLEILGIDYKGRLQAQKDIFAFREPTITTKLLKDNNIRYIYIPKVVNVSPSEERFGLKKIFENDEIRIFSVI